MKDWIEYLFGHGSNLNVLQMSARAFLAFFVALLQLRIAGIRTFGNKSAFDQVVVILLGSVLSRAVVGASPFVPTCAACFMIVVIHWALARISYFSNRAGRMAKGESVLLYAHGELNKRNMTKTRVSVEDLMEGLRLATNQKDLKIADEIYIERNGEISVVENKNREP